MGVTRYSKNPIVTREDVCFKINSIFNPGVTKFDGKYLLLCRVEMPTGKSSFVLAVSKDGYNFKVEDKPILTPEDHKEFYEYVEWGIEDARVTKIGDTYYLTYTGYSKHMPLVILSETKDFKSFKIHGPITEPSNKDCALFPEKIDGYYWRVDRPSYDDKNNIWISRSPDLIHWGGYKMLMEPQPGTWESNKIGSSSCPVKTSKGWLMLYHGVRSFGTSSIYKLGVVLLDLEKPWIVTGKSREPIISPEEDYERIGDVNNVIFSNGLVLENDGKVKIYYSGADMNICLAETTLDHLIKICT